MISGLGRYIALSFSPIRLADIWPFYKLYILLSLSPIGYIGNLQPQMYPRLSCIHNPIFTRLLKHVIPFTLVEWATIERYDGGDIIVFHV